MLKGGHKIFRDSEKLEEMLKLRKEGWSMPKLAVKFNCNHTSILHWLHKFKIKPYQKVIRELPKCKVCGKIVNAVANKFCSQKCYSEFCTSKKEKEIIEGERVNAGKTYIDYVREENLKKTERFRKLKIVLGLS